jgi:methionyl-tRNA synthetase
LIAKYFDGKTPQGSDNDEPTKKIQDLALSTSDLVREKIENFEPSKAMEAIVRLLKATNQFLEEKAPWTTAKTDTVQAGKDLYSAIEVLRISGILLQPVLPTKMDSLLSQIGCDDRTFEATKEWGKTPDGTLMEKGKPLFPRITLPEA